jgi:hypothetical protein
LIFRSCTNENFLVTAFSLYSSTQIIQCFRTDWQLWCESTFPTEAPSLSQSIMKDEISPQKHFYGVIYKTFLLQKDLMSKRDTLRTSVHWQKVSSAINFYFYAFHYRHLWSKNKTLRTETLCKPVMNLPSHTDIFCWVLTQLLIRGI